MKMTLLLDNSRHSVIYRVVQIIKNTLTYQKAFMVDKLKGNFTTVAKLEQIFKFL